MIGYYIPGVVLSYFVVMVLLLWPYIEYHQLHYTMIGYFSVAMAKLINKAVRWVVQMKEYAEDDVDIGTKVATLDDGFDKELGARRRKASAVRRAPLMSELDSRMDSFFGPGAVYCEFMSPLIRTC